MSQNRNQPDMDTVEDLRRKLDHAEQRILELTNQRNREMSHYEKEIMKLRLELERGEAVQRRLESELSAARKEADLQICSAEDQLFDAKTKLMNLQVLHDTHQQKAAETEKMLQCAQQEWAYEQQRFSRERDDIRKVYHKEILALIQEKTETEKAFQGMNTALQDLRKKLRDMETEHFGCNERLRLQADQLVFKADQQQKLIRELEAATARVRRLEESAESAKAAHLECKYTSQMMQLRIQELEEALISDNGSNREALTVLDNVKKSFRDSENAHAREKNVLQRQLSSSKSQGKGGQRRTSGGPSGKQDNAKTSFGQILEEGPMEELRILLDLYQRMADGRVLTKQAEVALEGLPWTEFCALLNENVEALIVNFHRAQDKIAHLEHICKQKSDTMREMQQNQEEAFEQISDQLKIQEHYWQKEKKHIEMQYANLLEEANARAQECEETVERDRQKLTGLEKSYEKLTTENNSVKNTLANIQRERSSLLAACALLAGALFPLYIRMCSMSSQRNLLQDQANSHELVNQKIGTIILALPTNEESSPDEARLRERRAKHLVFVFRKAVVAVLAVNRLRALGWNSCSLFTWRQSSRGNAGIPVCVGESKGRRKASHVEEEGVSCIEALDWLTSSNLYSAIISSISELQDVLNQPDPNSWLAGNSLINAARNAFEKLMDNLGIMMELVKANQCGCASYHRDSLAHRLACGLERATEQAMDVGLCNKLPSMRNAAILHQEVFELSRRCRAAEVESCSLRLQLEELKLAFSEMKNDAEKAQSLQKELHTLQQRMATQENTHEELNKALQREHEARSLLQQHEQRLQEISNILEVDSGADTDGKQDLSTSNVLAKSPSIETEELSGTYRVLHHQKRLLKQMEQDRQWLQANLQEAERALQEAEKEKELIIRVMKAVEDTLKALRDEVLASDPTIPNQLPPPLPGLQLEPVSWEQLRGMPEALAFKAVLISFMDIYQLAATRIEILRVRAEAPQVPFAPQAAGAPQQKPLQVRFAPQASSTSQDKSSQASLAPQAAGAPQQKSLRVRFAPQASSTPQDKSPQAPFTPQAAGAPHEESPQLPFVPDAVSTPRDRRLRRHYPFYAPSIPEDSFRFLFPPYTPGSGPKKPPPLHFIPQGSSISPGGSLQFQHPSQSSQTSSSDEDPSEIFLPQTPSAAPGEPIEVFFVPQTPGGPLQSQYPSQPANTLDEDLFQLLFGQQAPRAAPRKPLQSQYPSQPANTLDEDLFQLFFGQQAPRAAPRKPVEVYFIPQTPRTPPGGPLQFPFPSQASSSPQEISPHRILVPRGISTPLRSYLQFRFPSHSSGMLDEDSLQPRLVPQAAGAPHARDALPDERDPFSNARRNRTYTVSESTMPSSVFMSPGRIGTDASMDTSSNVMPNRTYTVSPASVTPNTTGTQSPGDTSSGMNRHRTYTVSESTMPSSVFMSPGRIGTDTSMEISSNVMPNRTYTVSPASVTPNTTGTQSPGDTSSGMNRHRTYTVSETGTPSSVFMVPRIIRTGSSTDISSNVMPNRTYTVSPASVTPNTTGTQSPGDTSSGMNRHRTYTVSESTMPSSVFMSPGRIGTDTSMEISSSAMPNRTYTVSPASVTPNSTGTQSPGDTSSGMNRHRTYTVSESTMPSSVFMSPGRIGTDTSMDISSNVMPNRTYTVSPASVTPNTTGTQSPGDTSSSMNRHRTYTVSETGTPSSVFMVPRMIRTGSSTDIPSNVMPNRTYTVSPASVTPNTTGTQSPGDTSSGMNRHRTYTVSESTMPSSVFMSPGRIGTDTSMEISSSAMPNRTYTVSPASVTPNTTGTQSPGDTSSGMNRHRTYTVSESTMPSSVFMSPGRIGTDTSMEISSSAMPNRTYTVSPASVTPNTTGTQSPGDTSSGMNRHRTYTVSESTMPSSVFISPGRIGTGTSMEISSDMMPNGAYILSPASALSSVFMVPRVIHTGSSTDISSSVMPNRTYTMSSASIPSSATLSRTGTGSSKDISSDEALKRTYTASATNTPSSATPSRTGTESSGDILLSFRPVRASSLPSIRSSSLSALPGTGKDKFSKTF